MICVVASIGTASAEGSDFAGIWQGQLTRDGEVIDAEWEFSADGFPVLYYTNEEGETRAIELSEPGQRIEYVPTGGGVKVITLKALAKDAAHVFYAVEMHLRTGDSVTTEETLETGVDMELASDGLHVSVLSKRSEIPDQDASAVEAGSKPYIGVLQRIQ